MKQHGRIRPEEIPNGIVEPHATLVSPPDVKDIQQFVVWMDDYLRKRPQLVYIVISYLGFRFTVSRGGQVRAIDAGRKGCEDAPALARSINRLLKKARSATR